jgi:hypothetical protein
VNRHPHAVALALAAALAPFAACSGGATATGNADASSDAGQGERVFPDAPPSEIDGAADSGPVYNADGWVKVDFDSCQFYAAPTPDKMPPRVQWEPCDAPLLAAWPSCRQIKVDWPPATGVLAGEKMPAPFGGWVDDSGKAWLLTGRYSGSHLYMLAAEADGPVHQALQISPGCGIGGGSLNARKIVYYAARGKTDIEAWGAIGGDVDGVPTTLEIWHDGFGRSYVAGPSAYFAFPEQAIHPWAPGPPLTTLNITDPGDTHDPVFVGDTLFFQVDSSAYKRIKVYDPANGLRDFVSFGNDVSANAADFGTDGKDMVWMEAFGRATVEDPWTTINIMTAPYTADPSQIQKRRLRSEAHSLGAAPFVVGFGYAAHDYSAAADDTGTRLIRISDGQSWRFRRISDPSGGYAWLFNEALAITSDELFISFHHGYDFQIARIRLDDLGPGDPPD